MKGVASKSLTPNRVVGRGLPQIKRLSLKRSSEPSTTWDFRTRQIHLSNCHRIVKQVAEDVLSFKNRVEDTKTEIHGHPSSTIDATARTSMVTAISKVFDNSLLSKDWIANLQFEDAEVVMTADGLVNPSHEQQQNALLAIIDEIDGTTNVKRAVAGGLVFNRPKAAVTIALLHNSQSSEIEVGVVYAIDEEVCFSGILAEGYYIAFRDERRIEVGQCTFMQGDSKVRVIVPCYSNNGYDKCAMIQQAIDSGVAECNCECYGGCRSSTMDVIDIIRNQYDAYVDLRALWTEDLKHNSVLRVYDIAAVIPIARGADLVVVNPDGKPFHLGNLDGRSPLSVIIGRPKVVEEIVRQIKPFVSDPSLFSKAANYLAK